MFLSNINIAKNIIMIYLIYFISRLYICIMKLDKNKDAIIKWNRPGLTKVI